MTRFSGYLSRFDSARGFLGVGAAIAALLAGCAAPPPTTKPSDPEPIALPTQPEPPPVVVAEPPPITGPISTAKTPKEYRQDAAKHLYEKNKDRIYKGRMPPLLYAVGTLHVGVNSRGMVDYVHWMRAPHHAPEVMAEIEKIVRAAAPYPAAVDIGGVIYTDTWLWHKSGKFQLDTLTEGQDGVVPSRPTAQNTAKPAATEKPTTTAAKPVKPKTTTKPGKKVVVTAESK
jgi:hypothetical protein